MDVIAKYRSYRNNEGRRALLVETCDCDDPHFDCLISAALQDLVESVQNEAVYRYMECDLERKQRIVPANTLSSWLCSVDVDICMLAIRLLSGRCDDVDRDVIRSLFYESELDVRAKMADCYEILSSTEKKSLLSLSEIIDAVARERMTTDERNLWMRILFSYPIDQDAIYVENAKSRIANTIHYALKNEGVKAMLFQIKYSNVSIDYDHAKRLASEYESSDESDDPAVRGDVVDTILRYLDRKSVTGEKLEQLIENDWCEYNYVLSEVLIRLLIEAMGGNNSKAMSADDVSTVWSSGFIWDYTYSTAECLLLEDGLYDAEKRFCEIMELYRALPLEIKAEIAPGEGWGDGTLGYHVDEGEVSEYMIAHLCYERSDLGDDTLEKIARNVKSPRYGILRESIDSIYRVRISAYDKDAISSPDETRRHNEVARLAAEISRVVSLEQSLIYEYNCDEPLGMNDAMERVLKIVNDTVFVDDHVSVDDIAVIVREVGFRSEIVFDLPRASRDWKARRAVEHANDGLFNKKVAHALGLDESVWPQVSDDTILAMSRSECPEIVEFALAAAVKPGRRADLYEKTLACAIICAADEDLVCDAMRRVLDDDEIRNSVAPLYALALRAPKLKYGGYEKMCELVLNRISCR